MQQTDERQTGAAQAGAAPPITFRRLIGTSISAKLLIDIGQQIFNPFLPVIAAGLGLDVVTLGRLVGLRSLMGIFAPVSGELADRTSYVISPEGKILFVYSALDPSGHVEKTMEAVKAWKASH